MKKVFLALVMTGALAGPMAAQAVPFSFDCITNNSATNCQTGETQLQLDVSQANAFSVNFTFSNSGPLASSITDIYFDWSGLGSILLPLSIAEGPGVDFSWGASPSNLPGGNSVGFSANLGADSNPAVQPNGVNPGEYITFNFLGSLAGILSNLTAGDLRVGIHAQGFGNGGSESFVNVPGSVSVPEPGTLALFGLALVGLGAARRRRAA